MTVVRVVCMFLVGVGLVVLGVAVGMRWSSERPSVAVRPEANAQSSLAVGAGGTSASFPESENQPPRPEPKNATISARGIVAQLAALKVASQDVRSVRTLLLQLERLREAGAAALPAIREFLATGQDIDYDGGTRAFRNGRVPLDFTVPPSLRLGLLEVLKNIGGAEAEKMLLRELQTTGRGVEAAYLGGVLQEIAPGKYRDATLMAARDLLAMPLTTRASNALDRSDRDYLYGVLAAAGDRSQIDQAQSQLVLPNGQLDPGALRYLQQMLGEQAVTIAAQTWKDARVAPDQREPLARVALSFAGTSASADELYRRAINDPALPANARKDLIEDLNQTGFSDPKHLTAADLPLIEKRLALIEQLAPHAMDRTNAAAFVEARKDLLDMRDAVLAPKSASKK